MKIWKLSALLAFMALFVMSCEDNTSDPDPEPDKGSKYFPGDVGKYWVYENYDVTVENFQEVEASEVATVDSVYVTAADDDDMTGIYSCTHTMDMDIEGESTQKVVLFKMKGDSILQADIGYLFEESNPILDMAKETLGAYLGSLGFIQIADFSGSGEWQILPSYDMDSMTISGFSVTDINYSITGKHSTTKNITIGTEEYKCQVMSISHTMKGKTVYQGFNADMTIEIKTDNYYAEGVGLVKTESHPASMKAKTQIGEFPLPIGDMAKGTNTYYVRGSY